MSSHRASDSCPPCSTLKPRAIPFFMNTSALKTFAPAVRKQLMEAVTRKLDFAIAAQTPAPAEIRPGGSSDPAECRKYGKPAE